MGRRTNKNWSGKLSGTDLVIARLDAASFALSEAKTIQDKKKLMDMGEALETFAKRQNASEEVKAKAHAFYIETVRLLGEALAEQPKAKGGEQYKARPTGTKTEPVPTLAEQGIDKKTSAMAQKLADLPAAQLDQVKAGTASIAQALKEVTKTRRHEAMQEAAKTAPNRADAYKLFHEDCENATGPVDWIITDPPYIKDALALYDKLGRVAKKTLKPGGSLICMTGQSYLPEYMRSLGEHLTYHWMLAYLTPGGQAVQLFQKNVNTFWKPVLWYTQGKYEGDWIGDVTRSAPNDNDKKHHEWGQSESGMYDLMRRFVKPGDTVLDPFMGAGTTGVVAVELGAKFIGYDIAESAYDAARVRLANAA